MDHHHVPPSPSLDCHHSYHYSNLFGDTTTTTEEHNLTISSSSSSLGPMARSEVSGMATIKAQGRRRSRASIKPPIRVLPAHKSNFRDIVQKLTGISNDITTSRTGTHHYTSNPNPSNPSNSMNHHHHHHHHHHHPYLKNPHGDPMIYSQLPHPHDLLINDSPPHLLQDMLPITLDTSSAYLLHRSSSTVPAPRSSSQWTPIHDDLTSNPPFNNIISTSDDDMYHNHHHHDDDVNLPQLLYPTYHNCNSMNSATYLGSLLHHHHPHHPHPHPHGNLVYTNGGGSSSTILPQYGVDKEHDDASCNVTRDQWGARDMDMVPYTTTFSTQPSVIDPRVGGLTMSGSGLDDENHKMMLCQADNTSSRIFMAQASELERLLLDNDLPHSHGSSSTINASSVMEQTLHAHS